MRRGRIFWIAGLAVLASGWVFARTPSVVGRPRPEPAPARRDVFASPADCAALVGAGQRLTRAPGTARFASWNLHWFPDGEPGYRGAAAGADLNWVACALGWLDADVIAVQEIKQSPSAEQALATLLTELNRLTKARYVARLDDCGRRVPQHVGLIWNEARVRASEPETVAALNPHGTACENQLRPGLAARFKLPGGLDLTAVSVHFKSMADRRAFTLRGRSFAAIPDVLGAVTAKAHDADFLLLGDLNTMGCDECTPMVSATDEVRAVDKQLTAAGLRLVTADAVGTELHEGRFTLLDHAVVSAAMREFSAVSRSHVLGVCASGARPISQRVRKQVRRTLSDHCPIVLDLTDRDLD